jgi:G3E family GTPase
MPALVSSTPIPVTVVTGFLGAGKSTLLERWLGELPPNDAAVIVNERGDVGIDGELLAAHVTRLREISGGCVCCSSQAELVSALAEFGRANPAPRRIFVETSGAASPSGVIRAVATGRAREHLYLDGVITVVDALRLASTLRFDLALEQLGFADVVVLSHVDRLPATDLDALRLEVGRHAPVAALAESRNGVVNGGFEALLGARHEALRVFPRAKEHTAIDAVSLVHEGELDQDRFADWVESELAQTEARILRVKGILAMRGVNARVIVQGVGGAVDVELGRPWENTPCSSRLVVLGLGLDAAELEAGFLRCASNREA